MKNTGRVEIVSKTVGQVVTVAELKEFCYISGDIDNALLTSMETAAVTKCEAYCRRPLLVQVSNLWFDDCVSGAVSTPFGKLNSVGSVKTIDSENVETVVDPSEYIVDTVLDQQGRIQFLEAQRGTREINSVVIEISNGYADVASVDPLIKEAIKSLVSFWYENREMYSAIKMPADVRTKLNPFRIVRL